MRRTTPLPRCLPIAFALASVAALAGCSVSPRQNAAFFQKIPIENRPVTTPVRSISSFSESLRCMDQMLGDYGKSGTLITSKIIPDATGKIAVATKDMAITALSQMSRTSNAFRYVDYEVDALRQDTVQNLTTLLLNAGQLKVLKPTLYISGALAYLDQNVTANRLGLGIASDNGEAGYQRDLNGSAIGLELHLGDFETRTLLVGIDSANEIVVANSARALDGGARIRKTGVQFNLSQEVSQGTGPAVRTLVELGLIELVGKWAQVPYWQCLALDQAHPEYQRQLYDWWEKMNGEERLRLMQTALKSAGYFNGEPTGKPTPALRNAVTRFQADRGIVVSGAIDFPTYEKLVADYVAFDGAGTFMRIGWGPDPKPGSLFDQSTAYARGGGARIADNPAYTAAAAAGRVEAPPLNAPKGRPIGIRLSIGEPNRTFAVGESLVATVSVDRQAYVYCYYQDSKRQVTQILPNPQSRNQPVQGGRFLQIPDSGANGAFSIDLNRAGREAVGCLAADRDVFARLPPELRAPPLRPMRSITDLDQVRTAFERAAGERVSARIIQYTVTKS